MIPKAIAIKFYTLNAYLNRLFRNRRANRLRRLFVAGLYLDQIITQQFAFGAHRGQRYSKRLQQPDKVYLKKMRPSL